MFRKILAAINRSPNGKAVFGHALTLTKVAQANLMLLHVLSSEEKDSPQFPTLTTLESYPLDEKLLEVYRSRWQAYEEEGLKLLRSYMEEAIQAEVISEFTQNFGSPSREICEVARTWEADLIVIGRQGHSSLNRLILGSVSNYVFHHASCSVLTVYIGVPIEIVRSRRQLEMGEALQGLGSEALERVEEVSIDLWKPYKSLVEELLLNAEIVADRFHVMQQVNTGLDAARKAEKRAALRLKNKSKKAKILAGINDSKYSY